MKFFISYLIIIVLMVFSIQAWATEIDPVPDPFVKMESSCNCAVIIQAWVVEYSKAPVQQSIRSTYLPAISSQLTFIYSHVASEYYRKTIYRESWEAVHQTDRTVLLPQM